MTSSIRAAAGSAVGSAEVPAGGCAATEVEVAVAEFVAASPWGRFASVFDADTDDGQVSEEVLLELRERRLATQQQAAPDGHPPGSCTRGCCDPDPPPF